MCGRKRWIKPHSKEKSIRMVERTAYIRRKRENRVKKKTKCAHLRRKEAKKEKNQLNS